MYTEHDINVTEDLYRHACQSPRGVLSYCNHGRWHELPPNDFLTFMLSCGSLRYCWLKMHFFCHRVKKFLWKVLQPLRSHSCTWLWMFFPLYTSQRCMQCGMWPPRVSSSISMSEAGTDNIQLSDPAGHRNWYNQFHITGTWRLKSRGK